MRPQLRARRRTDAALGALAVVIVGGVFAVAAVGVTRDADADALWSSAVWLGVVLMCGVLARLAISRLAPRSNEVIFGIVALLIGLGWVFVARIDPALARGHAFAVAAGFAALVGTLFALRRLDWLLRKPGTCALAAAVGIGLGNFGVGGIDTSGGVYDPPPLWLALGPLSVQPNAVAKLLIVIAACGLTITAPRWLPAQLLPHRHAAGAIVATVGAWTLLVTQGDFALSLVVFAAAWLPLWLDGTEGGSGNLRVVGLAGRTRALGAVVATYAAGTAVLTSVYDPLSSQVRHWLDPWTAPGNAASVEAGFAFSAGGVGGVGPGLGAPERIAGAHSDFVFTVISEELGILGGAAVLAAFVLLIGIGAGIAQRARGTNRLLAVGVTAVLGLQALLCIAGELRLLPQTALALPFVAYGPAAMVGSCMLAAVLLGVSDSDVGARLAQGAADAPPPAPPRSSPERQRMAPTGDLRVPAPPAGPTPTEESTLAHAIEPVTPEPPNDELPAS